MFDALFVVDCVGLSLHTVFMFFVGCITFGSVSFLSISILFNFSLLFIGKSICKVIQLVVYLLFIAIPFLFLS